MRHRWRFFLLQATATLVATAGGQPARAQAEPDHGPQEAGRLVREVVQNEVKAQELDRALWRFRLLKREGGKDRSFIACQATEGVIYRLVGVNGEALAPAALEAENKEVARLARHRDELRDRQRKVLGDVKQARKLLAAIPDALLFQFEKSEGDLVTVRFKPNPKFHPSGHAEAAFRHLEGTLVVDTHQQRLVEFRGVLTSDVTFFGGLLGHLDRGGTLWIRQMQLGPGQWELADVDVQMNGKALFFKTISVRQKLIYWDYQPLSLATTIEEAVARVLAENDQPRAPAAESLPQ